MICVRKRILGIYDFHFALPTGVTVVRDRIFAERGAFGASHFAVGSVWIVGVHDVVFMFPFILNAAARACFPRCPKGLRVGLPNALLGETNG